LPECVRALATVRGSWQGLRMAKVFPKGFKVAALRMLDKGVTTREAQAALRKKYKGVHVGEGTLRKWVKERDAAPPPAEDEEEDAPPFRVPQHAPLAPVAEPPVEEDLDLYTQTLLDLREARQGMREAKRDGNHTAATRYGKQIEQLSLLRGRLEAARKADTDAVTIPRVELEQARRTVRERVAALAADLERTGGLVCSHCGRALRTAIAKGER